MISSSISLLGTLTGYGKTLYSRRREGLSRYIGSEIATSFRVVKNTAVKETLGEQIKLHTDNRHGYSFDGRVEFKHDSDSV